MSWQDKVAQAAAEVPQDEHVGAPAVVSGRVCLIDGDYLAYYAAGNDETDPGRARQNALDKISAFKALSGADRVVIHITGRQSHKGWRYVAATVQPYQAQREGGRRPKNWESLRQWLEGYSGDGFKVKTWVDREADDGMAYHAKVLGPQRAVVATADKDMRMFPGIHIDWHTYELVEVPAGCFRLTSPVTGKLFGTGWFWQQMLQGDTADHIPGLPKYVKPNGKLGPIGEKTAAKLLEPCTNDAEACAVVWQLYAGYYTDEDGICTASQHMAEQAALLWMRDDAEAAIGGWINLLPEDGPFTDELWSANEALLDFINDQLAEVDRLE